MAPHDDASYHVWQAIEGNPQGAPPGKYLVDDRRQLHYLVDPGINGTVPRRDDGTEVLKFSAPKARLMALITDGILNQKLPWTLVLLGVAIAVVLELCSVPSLPFAVGVYLPLSSSTPILVGGLARYVADRWARGNHGAGRSETEADMSTGVLLSTGYIAGGAIAGVLVAFLMFSDTIPAWLATWQYRQVAVAEDRPLDEQYRTLAAHELGLAGDKLSKPSTAELDELKNPAAEIAELNADRLPRYVRVPKGSRLVLPHDKTFAVAKDSLLGDVAREQLGGAGNAEMLLDLNRQKLKLPERLPLGAELKLPQKNWPATTAFLALAVVLTLVGLGWWLTPLAAKR